MGIKLINGTVRNAFSGNGLRWQWHKLMLHLADARVANSKAGFVTRGIRHDGRQAMPQIVRDRACHAADSGKPLGFDQPALRFLQASSHAEERCSDLSHFVAAADDQGILVVSFAQGANAFHQGTQRTGEGVREDEDHATADHDSYQSQGEEQAVQAAQE